MDLIDYNTAITNAKRAAERAQTAIGHSHAARSEAQAASRKGTWALIISTFALIIAVLVLLFNIIEPAHAFDNGQYNGVDPKIRAWFKSAQTKNGMNCCDIADGRMVEWRRNDKVPSDYEVLLEDGTWQAVPLEAVLPPETGNPTGRGVAWFYPGTFIRCFMPGPEG